MPSTNVPLDNHPKARTDLEPEQHGVSPFEFMRQPFIAILRERLAAPQRVKVLLEDL